MKIFVMRHGQAEQLACSDQDRPLTEQGKLEAIVMANFLKNKQVEFDQVFVSPFLRAQQTAKTVMASLGNLSPLTTLDFITPMGSAIHMHDYIDGVCAMEHHKNILIVSHMPLVSYLVEELTVEQNCPLFQTAGIAEICYDLKRMKGHLSQLIAPNDLC